MVSMLQRQQLCPRGPLMEWSCWGWVGVWVSWFCASLALSPTAKGTAERTREGGAGEERMGTADTRVALW